MSRGVTSAFAAACAASTVMPFELIDLGFASGTSYVCGLDFSVPYLGNTYLPMLGLLSIADINETDGSAQGLSLQISGVPAGSFGMAMSEKIQGRPIKLRLALINSAGVLVADDNVWSGTMDVMTIHDGADQSAITITAEHMMATWARPRVQRYTDAQQQALYAGDLGLQYVADLENKNIVWPDRTWFIR